LGGARVGLDTRPDHTRGLGRLLGLRRGREPAQTRAGQPLRPLTVPNLVGYFRLALIAIFMVIALSSRDGRVTLATLCFTIAAVADYLDGLLARLTGQYSRLGALMDPFVDRVLVVGGVIVAWKFQLLPRWALAVLAAREVFMVATVGLALRKGLDIKINWTGRLAVFPTMSALGLALIAGGGWFTEVLLYVGLAGALAASVLYVRDGIRALRSWGRLPRDAQASGPRERGK
jgi:cardiolipin synthase (CMP-forming)